MTRDLRTFRTRPPLLGALLLPMLCVIGAGSTGSALETFTPTEGTSVPSAPATAVSRRASSPVRVQIDPLLQARRYLLALPYGRAIADVGARYRVDPLLIASVAEAESSFRVDAVSPKGALGLMQVMPFHVDAGVEPFDPRVNLALGTELLAELTARYDGRLDLALAAYHAGPGAVERYDGVPPYASTQHYVARVLEIYLQHYAQLSGGSLG